MAALVQYLATGRRKTSVARIFLRSGKGDITVNGRTLDKYFVNESARAMVKQPLLATEVATSSTFSFLPQAAVPLDRPAPPAWASPARSSNSTRSSVES